MPRLKKRTVIIRAGRKRKPNVVRDTSGKSRGEEFDASFFHNQPHRRDTVDPASEAAGFPLGRLKLAGVITEAQLRAGNAYAGLVHAYARTMGIALPSPRSGAMADVVASGFYAWDHDRVAENDAERTRRIGDLKARYDDCHQALGEVSQAHRRGMRVLTVLREICVQELDERAVWANDDRRGDLRLGLNTVERCLQKR